MHQSIKLALREAGLTAKEISLYAAALVLGESGITDLAAAAKLKKSTAYLTFESLQNKGLMGSFRTKSGTKFVATSPQSLVSRSEAQLEALKEIVPELEALKRAEKGEPRISYYHGKEGYFVAVEDFLSFPNSIVCQIGSLKEIQEVIGQDYDYNHIVPTRLKNRIVLKALYFRSELSADVLSLNHAAELRELRFLPKEYYHKAFTIVYSDKVAIVSGHTELVTVIIESPDIAEAERQKFNALWNLAGDKFN